VMRGRITNQDKAAQLIARMGEFEALMAQHRPELRGDVTILHADGTYTDVIYFASEAEAREGEKKPMPAEAEAIFEEFMATMPADEFLDLREPWLR